VGNDGANANANAFDALLEEERLLGRLTIETCNICTILVSDGRWGRLLGRLTIETRVMRYVLCRHSCVGIATRLLGRLTIETARPRTSGLCLAVSIIGAPEQPFSPDTPEIKWRVNGCLWGSTNAILS